VSSEVKPKAQRWTESSVVHLLAKHFPAPAYAFLTQVRNGTGYARGKVRTADAVAVSCWPSRGLYFVGIEIKVSYQDWRKELADVDKSNAIQKYCRHWYVAAPKGVVPAAEVPANWGLLECEKVRVVTTREAPELKPAPPDMLLLCSLLRNVTDTYVPRSQVQPMIVAAEEKAREHAKNNAPHDIKHMREMLERFKEQSGIDINDEWDNYNIGDAVRFVLDHKISQVPKAVEHMAKAHENAAGLLRKALVTPAPHAGEEGS
jgi:hypothetical protein